MSSIASDLDAILARIPDWAARPFTRSLAVPPVASPMQRGVDGQGWRVERDGAEAFFVKQPSEDAHLFVDALASADAARQAGALGVAPQLVWSDPGSGVAVWRFLGHPWRTATLGDLETPAVGGAVIETFQRLHNGPRFSRTRSVFDLVETYAAEAFARPVALPDDYGWMLDNVRDISAAMAASGVDTVPCHGDNIASNIMLGDGSAVFLVDWDEAVNADPYWDLGSFFAEAFPFDVQARVALERYAGRCTEALLARCRLYGIADDFAWATRSLIAATLTKRVDIEYFKYASWRFLRCRMDLRDRRLEERLRSL